MVRTTRRRDTRDTRDTRGAISNPVGQVVAGGHWTGPDGGHWTGPDGGHWT